MKWENDDEDNVLLFVPIVGITERIELSVEIPYMFHNPESAEENSEDGIGDINIVGKFLLIEEGEKAPAFTVNYPPASWRASA